MHVMLMDSALKHIDQARWLNHESRERNGPLEAAVRVVSELRSTLDVCEGGPYVAHLDDVCEYMSRRLASDGCEKRATALDEVADLLREVRSAWVMVAPCMTTQTLLFSTKN